MNYLKIQKRTLAKLVSELLNEYLDTLDVNSLNDIYNILILPPRDDSARYSIWIKNINDNKYFGIEGSTFKYKDTINMIPGSVWDNTNKRWKVPYSEYYDTSKIVDSSILEEDIPADNATNISKWIDYVLSDKDLLSNDFYGTKIVNSLHKNIKYAPSSIRSIYSNFINEFDSNKLYIKIEARSMIYDIIYPRKIKDIKDNGIYVYYYKLKTNHMYWLVGDQDKLNKWLSDKNIANPPDYSNVNYKFYDNGTKLYYVYNAYTGD